ncbi:MAG: tetratricopeptide repeat protein [Cycloclasticus sp.]|nr:tetratricopeptide repeat protein [Cycloclasticus sp.]
MSRIRFFQTGLPYLIIACLLMGLIIFAEIFLKSAAPTPITVSIKGSVDSGIEPAHSNILSSDRHSKLVNRLLQSIESDKLPIKSTLGNKPFSTLTADTYANIITNTASKLLKKSDYKNAEQLLSSLSPEQRIKQGVQFSFAFTLSKLGNSPAAIAQYELYTAHKPNAFSAIFNRALLLKRLGTCEAAILAFKEAAKKSSGYKKSRALAGLASCEYQLSRYEESVKNYKKSIEYQPNNAQTWLQLGKALSASNAPYIDINDAFKKAVSLNPKDPLLLTARATSQLQHYSYSSIIKSFKGLRLQGIELKRHRLLAWAYLEQGKRNNAKKHLLFLNQHEVSPSKKQLAVLLALFANKQYKELILRATKASNKSEELQYLKALAYRKSGRYKKSLPLFESLLNSQTYHWRARIQIARIKRSRKQYNQAVNDYQLLAQHNNTTAFLPFELALTYEHLDQGSNALKAINLALDIDSGNKTYLLTKARALYLLKRPKQALMVTDKLLMDHPDYVRGLDLKATLQVATNNPGGAIQTYGDVLTLQPSDIKTLRQVSRVLIKQSQYTLAQRYLARIIELQANDIEARYWLAFSYYQNKLPTQALNETNNILKLDQHHQLTNELKNTIIASKTN